MTALLRLATGIARVLALIGAAGVVAMMIHISLDVLLRNLFRISIHVTAEMVSRYYMVLIAFLPLSWLELRREMVSVELIDFAMPPRLLRLSDALVCLISAAVYAGLAWPTWKAAFSNYRSGTYVELVTFKMPVWHSYFLPPIGFSLAAFACVILALTYLWPPREETA
ncbi:TRAP transporter small permease [Maritimibacter alkaliphilus]|uniref:TRAP transporter small permease n=1 Tax=Maritimibacter alkaliphilus TaxID=404236 RepID=UPI001C93D8E4|nr:TRAP transporter small permease [Maritimibacter alkaliphilus]MBY6089623.1 TRAP transporter small permease [Maritimibacter alkaliphilus]